jgi:RimJ/RimL family protein N-acetyltransferase
MFAPDDADKLLQMSREQALQTWIPDQVYRDLEHARGVLEFLTRQYHSAARPEETPIVFGICLKSDGELIGHVGLSPNQGGVEIGYAIEERHQKKGYAKEAIEAMTQWALPHFHLPAILGIVAVANSASCRVLEKTGFALVSERNQMMHQKMTLVKVFQKVAP